MVTKILFAGRRAVTLSEVEGQRRAAKDCSDSATPPPLCRGMLKIYLVRVVEIFGIKMIIPKNKSAPDLMAEAD